MKIDLDPWVAGQGVNCLVIPKENLKGRYVAELLDNSGAWKEELIKENFNPIDASNIHNSIAGGCDKKMRLFGIAIQKGAFQ